MATLTIRNVPEEVHRAIRVRAAMRGHSTEAEVRDILEQAARPEGRVKLATLLRAIALDAGPLTDEEIEAFNQLRDKTPIEPLRFE